jgi:hypothetical protein
VASYSVPNGGFSFDQGYFNAGVTNGPLTAPSSASSGGNGVYSVTPNQFPTSTYQAGNYWVDVVFNPAPADSCPCSIWGPSATPAIASIATTAPWELGVKFRSSQAGYITGVRFYKGPSNTGTHVAHLWTSTGTLLASATFSNESGSGWQQAMFASPVAIQANTTYVASYSVPNGGFSFDSGYFANSGTTNGPLTALSSPSSGGNGVYSVATNQFPTNTYQAANYWVDVIFVTQP